MKQRKFKIPPHHARITSHVDSRMLDNGIHVHSVCMPQSQSLHLGVAVQVGSLHDPVGKAGLAHFLEHVLLESGSIPYHPLSIGTEMLGGEVSMSRHPLGKLQVWYYYQIEYQ